MSLLDKFKKVEVSNLSHIDSEDIKFCDKLHQNFLNKRKELEKNLEDVNKLLPLNHPYRCEPSNYAVRYDVKCSLNKSEITKENIFDKYVFSPCYAIKWIQESLVDITYDYVSTVVDYLNKKYFLNIKLSDNWIFVNTEEVIINEDVHYKYIIEEYIKHLNGVSLVEMGYERMKNKLRDLITYKNRMEIKKHKLHIENAIYYNSYSWRPPSFNYENSIWKFIDCFHFFETGLIKDHNVFSHHRDNDITFNKDYEITLEKITHLRFFKNNKLIITFRDENTLQQFVNFFELDKLENNRYK